MRSFTLKRKAFSVFFTLIVIPFLFLGILLSADCARIIMASHSASLLADNLSMAASTGISSDNLTLDTANGGLVYQRVNELFYISKTSGAINSDLSETVKAEITNLTPNSVTVNVSYTLDGLLLFNYLGGKSYVVKGQVSRTSGPCISTSSKSCAYLQ